MHAAKRGACRACIARWEPRAESSRTRVGYGGRLGACGSGLGVEQDRLGHGRRLILGDDDAAVAGVLEIDLRQGPVVAAAGCQWCRVQGIRLALGVGERVRLWVEEVTSMRLFCGRVQHGRGRQRV
jgi:hypothetical protein